MEETEFDRFADEYKALHAASIRLSGEAPEYFAEYKIVDIATELARKDARASAALDFGAGIGYSVPHFARHLPSARLTCLDVSRRSLDIGAARYGGYAEFRHFDGRSIPYGEGAFDVALASCVFHHIGHAEHVSLIAELLRVLSPGGRLFIFEHNPLNPLTRHAVNNCTFDENAQLIWARTMRRRVIDAGFQNVSIRYRIFFPNALRGLRRFEAKMAWLPLGAQYCVIGQKAS